MKIALSLIALLALATYVGCESNAPSGTAGQVTTAAPPPPEPAAPSPQAASPAAAAMPAQGAPASNAAGNQPAAGDTSDEANRIKAEVGVGKQGRDYAPGFITTPIAAKFRTEQRITFEVQIPNAMKLYKAAHDNKGPKTNEEFMDIIIKENGVLLPELPAGESYVYDPKTEELMVQQPKSPE